MKTKTEPDYITVARRVVENHQYEAYRDSFIDALTANAMMTVWDALSDEQRTKLAEKNPSLARYLEFTWKVVR